MASIIETRHQRAVREEIEASIDPAMREYLDSLSTKILSSQATLDTKVMNKVDELKVTIQEFSNWKPEMEACFTKIEKIISIMQAVMLTTDSGFAKPHGGSASTKAVVNKPLSTPPDAAASGSLEGQTGHGILQHLRGLIVGFPNLASPPVKGAPDFMTPMSAENPNSAAQVF
jgi:hypothetical protein